MNKINVTIRLFFIISMITIIGISCDKDEPVTKSTINGVIQKGPFINGTSLFAYELDNSLSPTGKNYPSQILDNSGIFRLTNVSFVSPYVLFMANGYYFNEITNQNSNAPITLYSLSDISDKSTVNVNILSNLEKNRIEYLIAAGKTFSEAKAQAEQEVLSIFSVSKPDISDFEALDITKDGEDNAILLAVSLICQGFRAESQLSDLLANISTDIREDGILTNDALGSLLINDARLLDLTAIRRAIENRYTNLGMQVAIPNFEKYVTAFINNSTYTVTNAIEYPEFSNYGENILYADKITFSNQNLSLAAKLPAGTSLKIIIKNGLWWYQSSPEGPVNWTISMFNSDLEEQSFTVTETGILSDVHFLFGAGVHTIEYYENNSIEPTKVKVIDWTIPIN